MDSSACQIVYLDGGLKIPSLEPPTPETTENKAILSFTVLRVLEDSSYVIP